MGQVVPRHFRRVPGFWGRGWENGFCHNEHAAHEAERAGQIPEAVARREGTPAHGANSVIILGGIVGGKFRRCAAKLFRMMVARDGIEPPTPAFSGL